MVFLSHGYSAELQAKVDAANGRWLQVGLKPNPVANVSSQEMGNDGSAGQHGVFVGQKFITANKLELNRSCLKSTSIRSQPQEVRA